MYSEGWGVKQDIVRAVMWYMVAVSNGNIEAIENQHFLENLKPMDRQPDPVVATCAKASSFRTIPFLVIDKNY